MTGFVLTSEDHPEHCVYVSGDTVWYEGVAQVARRFAVRVAVLFMGAARVPEVGPDHLTLTAAEGVAAAGAFRDATIVPLHFEGWAHFSQDADDLKQSFKALGIAGRLQVLEPGVTTTLDVG